MRRGPRFPAPEAMATGLAEQVAHHLPTDHSQPLGVAVSGGSDSLALLHLVADIAKQRGTAVHAVTVDHGLRPEAAQEARDVAALCAPLGVSHQTLQWDAWKGQGNLQDAARRARYDLMAHWAGSKGIRHIALGHTRDDQAETLLMRLARGAGVDGLSAMRYEKRDREVIWIRPLLDVPRAALQQELTHRGIGWAHDPSNDDLQFDRIKARRTLQALAPLGVDAAALAQVAANMQAARDALEHQTQEAARRLVTAQCGAIRIDWTGLCDAPRDILRRVVLASLRWVSRAEYPPRARALDGVLERLTEASSATLDGCLLALKGNNLWISRELNAIEGQFVPLGSTWDKRWILAGGGALSDGRIGPLGVNGLAACGDWRALGLPRAVLSVTPAVWQGENLVAAPLVKTDGTWQAVLKRDKSSLLDAVFAH